ncbi:ethanolamine ammonia-lyase subunit EutC [Saccharomonospora cyanea]|uniref:Ethanolamine ammonia-lyase small subunit n=1 Tax=Saccharomonospora cyanea NA-134 TaxID=882082 RepID=H5XHH0_9PSEU|nr:ethanolamine ammonia-lyase subunit EutC [Saccharomonospora cyanea]EHR61650.1 ethanolamine ammonia-lyase, small subunit [Saccharomonospora cyanea NA-134]
MNEPNPVTGGESTPVDAWLPLRRLTQARIGLGRTGDAVPLRRVLEFRADHANARDAIHQTVDIPALCADVAALGAGEPTVVHSQARDREEYLRRPDLGRVPVDPDAVAPDGADVGIVLADGLSPRALAVHGAPLLSALVNELSPVCSVAAPVVATQARVAIGDHIGAALGVTTVLVVIGERPGLSVADSLSVYLTHQPRPGRTDAERNCVSNIHPPDGLAYAQAAAIVLRLVTGARKLGRSGVTLKDDGNADALLEDTTSSSGSLESSSSGDDA